MKHCIEPDWPAPPRVRALTTTRTGGISLPPFDSNNLGARCGDDSAAVEHNRERFQQLLPSEPGWIEQVHGNHVASREALSGPTEADAVLACSPGLACTVLTADCLPVLFCDRGGTQIAAAHAGWRGLAGGVLEATIAALGPDPSKLLAWLGPGISVQAYEVGDELQTAVLAKHPSAESVFEHREGKLFANLYSLARHVLAGVGIRSVYGGAWCTYTEEDRFFSFRRDGRTGRMATSIWLA